MVIDVRGAGYVHVRGAVAATLLRADGRVATGFDVAVVAAGGQLIVQHAPGPVLVWQDTHPVGGTAGFGPAPTATPFEMGAGGGVRTLSETVASMRFTPAGPRLLHLRVEPGLLARIEMGGVERVQIVPEDGVLDVVAPGAPVRIDLRRLGGGALGGLLRVEQLAAEAIGEGLGAGHLYGAGDSRLFQFDVPARQSVGLGVRAGADALEAGLYDAAGAVVAAGYVQMPELAAGRYWFLLHLPGDAAPVAGGPALVGLIRPDAGPPADVVRTYLESSE